MVDLVAKTPAADLLPLKIGATEAAEIDLGSMHVLMPYAGQEGALTSALTKEHKLALPGPGASSQEGAVRAIWFGQDQVLLTGVTPADALAETAAISDQSDAWTTVTLTGEGAEDALARLVPVDLRAQNFAKGAVARTQIGHMNGLVMRMGPEQFLLMVFRSMAATLVHDLKDAMETIAARQA